MHAELYCVDPKGDALRYFGTAIGKGARSAKTEIEKLKLTEKTVEETLGPLCKMCVAECANAPETLLQKPA